MDKWEFNCPQFVDFSAGLENGPLTDEVFDGAPKHEQDVPNEGCVEAFVPKMATPQLRCIKSLRNSPFVNVARPTATDDEKVAVLKKLHSRLSKSDGCLNEAIKNLRISPKENLTSKSHPKRSLSDCCIIKKIVCPTTPNCLKRTLISKQKKAKTSEEMELETIAELQNRLQQHLRLNRMNLKRLKMNKAPFPFSTLSREKNCKAAPLKNKDFKNLRISSKPLPKYGERKLRCPNEKTCDDVSIYKELVDNAKSVNTKVGDMKKPFVANALRDLNGFDKDCKNDVKKLVVFEAYKGHGGLKFVPKQKETFPENFSFDLSSSSINESLRKINAFTPASTKTPRYLENKENLVK